MLGLEAVGGSGSLEDRRKARIENHLEGVILMSRLLACRRPGIQAREGWHRELSRMRKRPMAEIMKERAEPSDGAKALDGRGRNHQGRVRVAKDHAKRSRGHLHRTQTMAVPIVRGPWIRLLGKAELLDLPQPLELSRVD